MILWTFSQVARDRLEVEDELMSESVPGSQNEVIRRQFVHLPPSLKHNDPTSDTISLWWSSNSDDQGGPQDRIQLQMKHVPRNYQLHQPRDQRTIKTIYLPGGPINSVLFVQY